MRKLNFKVKIEVLFMKEVIKCDHICTQKGRIIVLVATATEMSQHHKFLPHSAFEQTLRREISSVRRCALASAVSLPDIFFWRALPHDVPRATRS